MNTLVLATDWADVEKAAAICETCIQPKGPNWSKAKQDWQDYPGMVEYLLSDTSYARVVRLVNYFWNPPLWYIGWYVPQRQDHLEAVLDIMRGWVLVGEDVVVKHMKPFARLPLPSLARPPWVQHMGKTLDASRWLLFWCNGEGPHRPFQEHLLAPIEDTGLQEGTL